MGPALLPEPVVALGALVGSHVHAQQGDGWRLQVRRGRQAPVLYEFVLTPGEARPGAAGTAVWVTAQLVEQARSLDALAAEIAVRLRRGEAPCPLSPR